MSEETSGPPSKFKYAFPTPGEMIPEDGLKRFEPYLSRQTDEADAAYAARLERLGLAVVITFEDVRDIATYRGLTREAIERRLPVAMLTSPIFDDDTDDPATHEAAKAAALEAARQASTVKPR